MKNKSAIMIIVPVVIIIVLVLFITSGAKKQSSLGNYSSTTPITQGGNNVSSTATLFSSSPLSRNAYLISTPTYDSNTQAALSGINVVKYTLADGSIDIKLNTLNGAQL